MSNSSSFPMLEVKSLVKKYSSFKPETLKGISFSLYGGEVMGFLGPNGAGKTTTLSIISGALKPTTGQVLVEGIDISEKPVLCKMKISIVAEQPFFWERLNAIEYLTFIGKIRGLAWEVFKERTEKLLKAFSLWDDAGKLIETYSYGMKQKLAWCAALMPDTKILLLDEPFTGLDPYAVRTAKDLIRDASSREGRVIIISTHNLSVAEDVCSRICLIDQGRIIADEDKKSLINHLKLKSDASNPFLLEEVFFKIINKSDE